MEEAAGEHKMRLLAEEVTRRTTTQTTNRRTADVVSRNASLEKEVARLREQVDVGEKTRMETIREVTRVQGEETSDLRRELAHEKKLRMQFEAELDDAKDVLDKMVSREEEIVQLRNSLNEKQKNLLFVQKKFTSLDILNKDLARRLAEAESKAKMEFEVRVDVEKTLEKERHDWSLEKQIFETDAAQKNCAYVTSLEKISKQKEKDYEAKLQRMLEALKKEMALKSTEITASNSGPNALNAAQQGPQHGMASKSSNAAINVSSPSGQQQQQLHGGVKGVPVLHQNDNTLEAGEQVQEAPKKLPQVSEAPCHPVHNSAEHSQMYPGYGHSVFSHSRAGYPNVRFVTAIPKNQNPGYYYHNPHNPISITAAAQHPQNKNAQAGVGQFRMKYQQMLRVQAPHRNLHQPRHPPQPDNHKIGATQCASVPNQLVNRGGIPVAATERRREKRILREVDPSTGESTVIKQNDGVMEEIEIWSEFWAL